MGTQIPHPGEAKLSGSDPLPLCDLGEFLDDLDVLLYVLERGQRRKGVNPSHFCAEPLRKNVRSRGGCHFGRGLRGI